VVEDGVVKDGVRTAADGVVNVGEIVEDAVVVNKLIGKDVDGWVKFEVV